MIRDLFGYQSPLRQEYFYFGRVTLVDGVIDLHRSGQNSGLFGLRKSGKTSTIFAIQRRAKTAGCRTVRIDCQDPAIHAKSYGSLLEYTLSTIRSELNLRKIPVSLGVSADKISENFRSLLNQSLGDAKTDVLIIFDEIENISPQTAASSHWRQGQDTLLFWQILRACFQNPSKYRVTFCFVGTNPHLFELTRIEGIDNPVYLFAPKTFIPMLAPAETREMVSRLGYFMGLDFDETVISHIHKLYGGHPYFVRQFCSHIHKRSSLTRPRTVSLKICTEIERDAGFDIKGYLDEVLNTLRSFYPDEQEMLEFLARGDRAAFDEFAAESPQFLEHLLGYGIVVRRGDDYEFAFDAIARAAQKNLLHTSPTDLESRRTEISNRRNRVEEEIRAALFRWARSLSQEEWTRTVSRCLTNVRKQQIGDVSITKAFSKRNSPLNFSETLKFVQEVNDFGIEGISTSDITSAMDVVNKLRIDAHAGTITDTDYTQVTKALDLLDSVFIPPD